MPIVHLENGREGFVLGIKAQLYLTETSMQVGAALARGMPCPLPMPTQDNPSLSQEGSLDLSTWSFWDDLKPLSMDQLGPSMRNEGFISLNILRSC